MDLAQRLSELGKRLRTGGNGTPASHDPELSAAARMCREALAAGIDESLGPFDPLHLRALRDVPRERFVREADLEKCAEDMPLPLDDLGLATISAPHAYLLSFRLLALAPGDRLVELGTGSGYGAALASTIVGERGEVVTFEIDDQLYERARTLLAPYSNVTALHGDAVHSAAGFRGIAKVVCTFAVDHVPPSWLDALPEGGILVAPVGSRERDQQLTRFVRTHQLVQGTQHGGVRYVKNRSPR